MDNIIITLKGLQLNINPMHKVNNDFILYNDIRNINNEIISSFYKDQTHKSTYILENESKISSYLHKSVNDVRENTELLIDLTGQLKMFLNCLWLISDFSVLVKEGIVISSDKGIGYLDITTSSYNNSNLRMDLFYKDGEVSIGKKDLNHANAYYNKMNSFNKNQKHSNIEKRLNRAIAFINEARQTINSYVRISFMVMSLECILGNQKGESVSNTALKTAYLNINLDKSNDFNKTYKFIKKCYGIRSTFVHGDYFSDQSVEDAKSISKELELLLKDIIKGCLDSKKFRELLKNPSEMINELTKNFKLN